MLECCSCHSCLSYPSRTCSSRNPCAVQSHCSGLYSCHLLCAQLGKQIQNVPSLCWQPYWLQGKLSLVGLMPRTGWSCNMGITELDLLSTLEKTSYSSSIPTCTHQSIQSTVQPHQGTSSKAEKLNKAVKPHFCNYVQQLHRNQNFFMSVDWVKAKRLTYSLLLSSHFILCWTTWKPWKNKQLAILLERLSPKGIGGWGKNFTFWKIYILWTVIRAVGINDLSAHWLKEVKIIHFRSSTLPLCKSVSEQKWPQSATTTPFTGVVTSTPAVLPSQKCSAYAKLGAEKWFVSLCWQAFVARLKPNSFHAQLLAVPQTEAIHCKLHIAKSSVTLMLSLCIVWWRRRDSIMQPVWRQWLPAQIKQLHLSQKIII